MPDLLETPDPPYVAVIFTSTRHGASTADTHRTNIARSDPDQGPGDEPGDKPGHELGNAHADGPGDGYDEMAVRMDALAAQQPGYLGIETARVPALGISVSYWATEADAQAWKHVSEHLGAQTLGRERWYKSYTVRVATVTRQYDFGL